MNSTRAKIISIALAAGLLVAGAFIGVIVDRRWTGSSEVSTPAPARRSSGRLLNRFKRRLELDDQQVVAVGKILEKSRSETRALRHKRQQEILALLTPVQQEKYQRMIKRLKERRKARRLHRKGRRSHRQRGR